MTHKKLRHLVLGATVFSATVTLCFYLSERLMFSHFVLLPAIHLVAILSAPGVFCATIVAYGIGYSHGKAPFGGELWPVAMIAFLFNLFFYAVLTLVSASLVRRFKNAGK